MDGCETACITSHIHPSPGSWRNTWRLFENGLQFLGRYYRIHPPMDAIASKSKSNQPSKQAISQPSPALFGPSGRRLPPRFSPFCPSENASIINYFYKFVFFSSHPSPNRFFLYTSNRCPASRQLWKKSSRNKQDKFNQLGRRRGGQARQVNGGVYIISIHHPSRYSCVMSSKQELA